MAHSYKIFNNTGSSSFVFLTHPCKTFYNFLKKLAHPCLFFCFFRAFHLSSKTIFLKNCLPRRDSNSDHQIEGEHSDHLTTTTAHNLFSSGILQKCRLVFTYVCSGVSCHVSVIESVFQNGRAYCKFRCRVI